MKLKLIMALAAALVLVPVPMSYAADAPAAEKEKAKPKKKMAKKPFYTKFSEAMKVAEVNEEPVLVLMCFDQDKRGVMLEKDLFKWPQFAKDYAKNNLILLKMKLKPTKDGQKVDFKASFKTDDEKRFLENHGLNARIAALAKQKGAPPVTAADAINYPAILCVKGGAENQELLFRMDSYDRDGGPGVWLASLDALLRTKEIEPTISKEIQKILDDPTSVAGKKKR